MHTALCLYEHKELGSYKNNMSAYQALRLLMKLLHHKRKAVNCWLIKAGTCAPITVDLVHMILMRNTHSDTYMHSLAKR